MHIHVLKQITPEFLNKITQSSVKNLKENSIPWNEHNGPPWEHVHVQYLSDFYCFTTGVCYMSTDGGLLQGESLSPVSHNTPHFSHTLAEHLMAVVSSWDISFTISGLNTSIEKN